MAMSARRLLAGCLILLLYTTTNAQIACPTSPVILQNSQLNSFDGCTTRQGDLVIGSRDCSQQCEVSSLNSLGILETIQGSLIISCCPNLITIDGLTSLRTVDSIDLYFNNNLTTISGFNTLVTVSGYVRISQHPSLVTLSGFSSLLNIGSYLEIDRNPALTNVTGLNSIDSIRGNNVLSGNALTIVYNPALTDLSFLATLRRIVYGTVRIEGNTALCYAGYPQWGGDGQFSGKTGSVSDDRGLDWRPYLTTSSNPIWLYTWGVDGGYPTLVIQNNAPSGSCGAASCHSSCMPNAGCLGPDNPNACGTCETIGSVNTCDIFPREPTSSALSLDIILAVVISVVGVAILLVVVALGICGCVRVGRRYKTLRQGSFDISVNDTDSNFQLKRDSRAAQQIASMAEPTTGANVTRRAVKYTPKLDSVIISSNYHQNTFLPDETPSPSASDSYADQTDGYPERARDQLPSTGKPQSPRSTEEMPSTGKARTSTNEVPPAGKARTSTDEVPPAGKARTSKPKGSRPKSETDVSAKKTSNSSLTERTVREQSTENILQRMREEKAEVPMNFPWDNIKLGKELGTGDFGKVFHAEARKLLPGQKKTLIMVKQLKEGATKEERETFLRPVEAMKALQHPNVLSLLGVSTKGPSICVMLEYCSQGNFKTFLVRKRRESMGLKQNTQLITMAIDMAAGLKYLHSKNIAHNDFAARSCLVTSEGKIKLGDYGITRQTFKEDYYARKLNQKALPIRWMAPEQIVVQGRNMLDSLPVSLPGNIWSFGVALWEICSLAQWPYDDLSNEEVLQTLKTTGRCILENPLDPTDRIAPLFVICESCWQPADLRPTMGEILTQLQELLKNGSIRSSTNVTSPAKSSGDVRVPVKHTSQGDPSTRRPKSQSLQPAPRKEGTNEDASKRRTNIQKPRRAAPTRPAPSQPKSTSTYPRSRGRLDSQEEPLVICNSASQDTELPEMSQEGGVRRMNKEAKAKKTISTEKLISDSPPDSDEGGTRKPPRYSDGKTKATDKPKSTKSTKTASHSDQKKKKKPAEKSSSERRLKRSAPVSEPHKVQSPPPQETKEVVQEEQPAADNEDDFILEPPPRFSQEDELEEEFQGAVGGGVSGPGLHFEDLSDEEDIRWPPQKVTEERRESNIERKIREKKSGGKILQRQVTPAFLSPEETKALREDLGLPDPTWESDEGDQFDENEYVFDDDFNEREAMEEDDLPNVVLDEDEAALIW